MKNCKPRVPPATVFDGHLLLSGKSARCGLYDFRNRLQINLVCLSEVVVMFVPSTCLLHQRRVYVFLSEKPYIFLGVTLTSGKREKGGDLLRGPWLELEVTWSRLCSALFWKHSLGHSLTILFIRFASRLNVL